MKSLWKRKPKVISPPVVETKYILTLDEFFELLFLALPYIKLVKRLKAEYNASKDEHLFRFIISGLLAEMERPTLLKIFAIITHKPVEEVEKMTVSQMVALVPKMIMDNNLLELYHYGKQLGVIDK